MSTTATPLPLKDKALILVFAVLASVLVGLAIAGAVVSYSPVPFEDMWDGYVGFFMNVSDGHWGAWWDNHNEHRLVLSRALFWADLKWFGGASWFLLAANYVLFGASAFMLWRMLREPASTEKPTAGEIMLGLFVAAWLFQWMQFENLTRAFNIQCVMAQLLPLCALYWLHRSVKEDSGTRQFLIACGFGLASIGTMANGILALPLMALYALLMRQGLARVGLLAALSVTTILLYFHDYHAPAHHSSLSQALRDNPIGFVQYVLLYLGSPFYHLHVGQLSKPTAQIAGLALVSGAAWFTVQALRKPKEMSLQLALLFFLAYIGGTALGTAGGRLIFGVDQALSSRYTTPALMAWSALLVLCAPYILAAMRAGDMKFPFAFAALGLLMTNTQSLALQPQDDELFERKIAALALELQIKDQTEIKRIYPYVEQLMPNAGQASERNLSVFGMYPFREAFEQLSGSVRQRNLPPCQGYLDSVEAIAEDSRFVRINGWIFNPGSDTGTQAIRIVNQQGQTVGYALVGKSRTDVAKAVGAKAEKSGYRGYLLASQQGEILSLRAESPVGPSCQMQANIPMATPLPASTPPTAAGYPP